jgi:hypothetical protein
VHRWRFNFLCAAMIWCNRDTGHAPQPEAFENVIVFNDEFYQEITEHPIPTDPATVRVLSPVPATLDLFVLPPYRCFSAKGEEEIQ